MSVRNEATGHRWLADVDRDGHYFLESLSVGGPYEIEVVAPGFRPESRRGIRLSLGQRLGMDFELEPVVIEAERITVQTESGPLGDAARTGPAQTVGRLALARLPVRNRDVRELARESPWANDGVFGLSISGRPSRYNSFQVDGGVNNNLYGRFSDAPGDLLNLVSPPGGGGLRTIPIDAVQELQVLVSPFDVREGDFTGGVVNIVTRSGSNAWTGSAFATLQDDALVGDDIFGDPEADFTTWQYGGTFGGPIVRDRVHFLAATDLQASSTPSVFFLEPGMDALPDSVYRGIRHSSAVRFQRILREVYGVDPGGFGPLFPRNPARSLFAKISAQVAPNSLLEVSQTISRGEAEGVFFDRDPLGAYDLDSADIPFGTRTRATRANWSARIHDRLSNELRFSHFRSVAFCGSAPFAFVSVQAEGGVLNAGEKFPCTIGKLEQQETELTENLTIGLGAHRVTAGFHGQLLHFNDPVFPNSNGRWFFESLDSLAQGIPAFYERTVPGPLRPEGPLADLDVRLFGLYLQDQWTPRPRLVLTAGLRLDAPVLPDRPVSNPALIRELDVDAGGISGNWAQWSPRFGFHYEADEQASTVLRGGIGLFTGRPLYYMLGDLYRSTGLEQQALFCEFDEVPDFTLDRGDQPIACRTSAAAPIPIVTVLDPNYRFPQDLKLALGIDRRLPGGLVGTLDFLWSRARIQPFFEDVNLLPPSAFAAGEAGRPLYGTFDPATGEAFPLRRSDAFGPVVRQTTRSGDRSVALSGQIQGRVGRRLDLNASYTISSTRDLLSPEGLGLSLSGLGLAADMIAGTPLDGTLEDPRTATSLLDVPHRFHATGTVELPYGVRFSAIYNASSNHPYTYVIDGDANGDGFGPTRFGQQSNDIVYVPRNAAPGGDIALVVTDPETGGFVPAPASEYARLEAFIQRQECLRGQRGRIMRRNSCRNSWLSSLDASVSKVFPVRGGGEVEIVLDVFNFLNLLDRDWGRMRFDVPFGLQELVLLQLVGYEPERGRGVFTLVLPTPDQVDVGASRWRAQLGARYRF